MPTLRNRSSSKDKTLTGDVNKTGATRISSRIHPKETKPTTKETNIEKIQHENLQLKTELVTTKAKVDELKEKEKILLKENKESKNEIKLLKEKLKNYEKNKRVIVDKVKNWTTKFDELNKTTSHLNGADEPEKPNKRVYYF